MAAVVFRFRLAEARRQSTNRDAYLQRLSAFVTASSAAALMWRSGDAEPWASPNFGEVLGRPDPAGAAPVAQLLDAVPHDDRGRIQNALDRFRADGSGFRTIVGSRTPGRVFEVTAERTRGLDAVWVRDVTATESEMRQKTAEAAAWQKTVAELTTLFDALNVPVWLRGPDLTLVQCNQAYARAVEVSRPSEAVAEGLEITGAAQGAGRTLAAEAVVAEGKPVRKTLYVVVEGARRLLEITEVLLPATGQIAGFAIDHTELAESRDELSRHIADHAGVLEKLGTAIAIYGPDARMTFFNAAFARLWDLEDDWLRTGPSFGEVLEELRARRRLPEQADFKTYKREMTGLFTSLLETREELLHLPDERVLRMVIHPHPLGGLLTTYEDVTDRMALERSYNTLIAVQRETLDNLQTAVAVYGSDGRLRLRNPAFDRIWGLSPQFTETQPHVAEVAEAIREHFVTDNWPVLKERIVNRATDYAPHNGRFLRRDGIVLDYAAVPLPDGGMLFSYLDVSDSIKVERALRERNEALETADSLKSEFITNVSYELRTPLNTIIGFTEILANQYFGSLNDRQTDYARGILEASRQLLGLIDAILDLALVEAGRMTLDRRPIAIVDMLNSVQALSRERARKQGIEIALACDTDAGTMVGDERRLKQALFNLISNAIQYTPPGGRIELSARRDGNAVTFAVADTGIGIRPEDRERIFGKFERTVDGRLRSPGLGVGLSLVKSFIELHGGEIELESAPGQGTTVMCRLPIESPEPPAGTAAAPAR
ncbi:MAG TPA: ATP-binding protein [Alphaproteobacteria bacterium]|jgi:signal transduction histidine kinase|nr:ATP-binding protein [Alphaproteobacteria bacterium]